MVHACVLCSALGAIAVGDYETAHDELGALADVMSAATSTGSGDVTLTVPSASLTATGHVPIVTLSRQPQSAHWQDAFQMPQRGRTSVWLHTASTT